MNASPPPTGKGFWAGVKSASKWVEEHLASPAKPLLFFFGAIFALDQLWYQSTQSSLAAAESAIGTAAEQLDSGNPAIRANALRSLFKIAYKEFPGRSEGDAYLPGAHITNKLFQTGHYPFYVQCRELFVEYGRVKYDLKPSEHRLVSSAYGSICSAWSIREKTRLDPQPDDTGGSSLFYGMQAPHGLFANCDFSNIHFGPAGLDNTEFSGCNIEHAGFDEAALSDIRVAGGTGKSGSYKGATLKRSEFRFIDLRNVRFDKAKLDNAKFIRAKCVGAVFADSSLSNALFRGVDLSGADFTNANLTNVRFDQCVLENAVFCGAVLEGTNLPALQEASKKESDKTEPDQGGSQPRSNNTERS